MEVNMTAKTTKQDTVVKLLMRAQGATVEQLQKSTGWQPHSIRAALTGLRKKGHDVTRGENAMGATVYRIAKAAN
jgi:hypothetical protein